MSLENDIYILNLVAHSFTATKDAITTSDLKITDSNQYLHSGELFTKDGAYGDWIEVQIIDIDNVLGYGVNTILRQYIKKFFINPTGNLEVRSPYIGKTPTDVYIRIIYHSVGLVLDPKVYVNLFFHTKVR